MVRIIGIVALLCYLVSCKTKQPVIVQQTPPVKVDSVIVAKIDTLSYYERTACFGMCPIFKCVVLSNGEVFYEGRNFVDRIGFFQTTWNPTALQKITQMAEEIKYFSMNAAYDHAHVTDLPSVITRLHMDNKDLTIVNRYNGPKDLIKLYTVLDDLIEKSEWNAIENLNKQ